MADKTTAPTVAIGIPVRNEVERLPRLFTALSRQRTKLPINICLFFDSCSDGSLELAARLAASLPLPLVSERDEGGADPNAGRARGRAMALAMQVAPTGFVLTTDADSLPDPDWVSANVDALTHADIVAGRISRAASAAQDLQQRVSSYFDRLHMVRRWLDPVPWEDGCTHHWTSGASLGFRAPVYAALGGFPALPNGEDAAIVDAAMRAGYRVRRDARVVVHTSSRRQGRALLGLAAALTHFDAHAEMPDVVHPEDEAWRFGMQAAARACFEGGNLLPLSAALRLDEAEVMRAAHESINGEAFAAKIVGPPPSGTRLISLAHAEVVLGALETSILAGAA
jgi:hypothetical protein